MQPVQCVLQHDVANPHASTHMASPDDNNHAAIPMRSATTGSRNASNYAHKNNHSLQNTEEEPIDLETIQTAPAAHRRYLSLPAAATLHGKTQGFVLRLPPQNKAHATFMQPVQCVLQHDVANPHASTHMASPDDNNHAAIPMRSATTGSRNASNYAHRNNRSLQNTEEEPINFETIQTAPAAYRRYLSLPAAAPLHGKTQGFVLRLPPQNKAHATFMQPLQCVLQHDVANPHASTHMASPDDNSHAAIPMRSATTDSRNAWNYAHRNNHSLQNTEEEPIDLETIQTAPAAHRRYLSVSAAATLHGKTQGFVLRLPPQNKAPATFMQPLHCVLQHGVATPHASTHMASPDDNNHAAIPMRSATTDSKSHRNTPQHKPHATFMQVNSFAMYCYVV